jgi:pimeloyl-ACP methyl ester carboxylesterase
MQDHVFSSEKGDFHWLDFGGQGPLTHISHATGFCARTYAPLAERLNDHLHLIGMDDRGHGRSTAEADTRRIKDWGLFVDDLELFCEHLGKPIIAVGHSRGGATSLMLAVRRPNLVRAVILIDPTIIPFSWGWWWALMKKAGLGGRIPIAARAARRRWVWPDWRDVHEAYVGRGIFKDWKDGFLEGYLEDGLMDDGKGRVRLSCLPEWESRVFATCNHDLWRHIPRLTQPVLVLYGRNSDTFLPAAEKRFRRLCPDTVFVGLEDTSHFVPMERPDETAAIILKFLGDHRLLDIDKQPNAD